MSKTQPVRMELHGLLWTPEMGFDIVVKIGYCVLSGA